MDMKTRWRLNHLVSFVKGIFPSGENKYSWQKRLEGKPARCHCRDFFRTLVFATLAKPQSDLGLAPGQFMEQFGTVVRVGAGVLENEKHKHSNKRHH